MDFTKIEELKAAACNCTCDENEKTVYFPRFCELNVECHKCERIKCANKDGWLRARRDITVKRGRCPKIPDKCGFVDESESANQERAYPLIFADARRGSLSLWLHLPDEIMSKQIYRSGGNWYYKDWTRRTTIIIGSTKFWKVLQTKKITDYVNTRGGFCILPCEILTKMQEKSSFE